MELPPRASEYIIQAKRLGYIVFEGGRHKPYNLNIVGWRNKNARPNYFDDWLSVYWQVEIGWWKQEVWPITTYPGVPWLKNPINPKGAAIMVAGQYEGAYTLGAYKGRPALLQTSPIRVYRDNDLDGAFDLGSNRVVNGPFSLNPHTIEKGMFGIHIHRGSVWARLVGASSAGCQVFQSWKDHAEFMDLCTKASKHWGKKFTYTLMEM